MNKLIGILKCAKLNYEKCKKVIGSNMRGIFIYVYIVCKSRKERRAGLGEREAVREESTAE